jgi:hypothetical protein
LPNSDAQSRPGGPGMSALDIVRYRLHHQRISNHDFQSAEQVVSWMGAVQAQDFLGALWAVGLRLRGSSEGDIEQALGEGSIVRTWPMRGTLHFVAAADVRWMLKLMTPRILERAAGRLRDLELDAKTLARSRRIFEKAMAGGRPHSRPGMYKLLDAAGIQTDGGRGLHILWQLAQDGLICFGPRQGKQQTFVLLDEWIPKTAPLDHSESLGRVALRYFRSHGPATLPDLAWWSGLKLSDAKLGLDQVRTQLAHAQSNGQTYWMDPALPDSARRKSDIYLLPAYDEYFVAYKERSAALGSLGDKSIGLNSFIVLGPTILVDGQLVGTWKRVFAGGQLHIRPQFFTDLTEADHRKLISRAEQLGKFVGSQSVRIDE